MAKRSTVTTDPIADLLTRIRNAMSARHDTVTVPYSSIKMEISKILMSEGFIKSCEQTKDDKDFPQIQITFKNIELGRAIQGLRRISKPGLRVYSTSKDLPKVLNGLGIAIISTSKGIMTDKNAREHKLGGEVLAYVW